MWAAVTRQVTVSFPGLGILNSSSPLLGGNKVALSDIGLYRKSSVRGAILRKLENMSLKSSTF